MKTIFDKPYYAIDEKTQRLLFVNMAENSWAETDLVYFSLMGNTWEKNKKRVPLKVLK